MICRRPGEPSAGLRLESRVRVMFQFRTESQAEEISKPDLILNKNTREVLRLAGRVERNRVPRQRIIGGMPVSEAPYDVLAGPEHEMILKVEVEGVGELPHAIASSVNPIIRHLKRDIRTARESVRPTAQNIATTGTDGAVEGLIQSGIKGNEGGEDLTLSACDDVAFNG